MALRNRAKMTISGFAGNGTTALNLGSAVAGYQTFADANVASGEVVTYCIEETGGLWELGTGTYTSGSPNTLTRSTVIASSSGTSLVTFTTAATVYVTASAADLVSPGTATTFTANQTFPNTGLRIKDVGTNVLTISTTEDYTADRTLNFVLGDSNRTLTLSGNATISGTNTGDQTITLTGDVTGSGTGSFATTIGAGKVTLANMADLAQWALIGRSSSPAGAPQAIATSQDVFTLLGSTSTANFRSNLGANAIGSSIFTLTNPGAVTFLRMNADNTVTARSATDFKTDLSLNNVENTALSTWVGTSSITTLGTVSTGTWQGTAVAVSYGGTGTNSFTSGSLLKGAGTSAITTATAGTDFVKPGTLTVGAGILAAASASGYPSLNIPSGTAPSSPASGDIWNVSGTLYYRDAASTTRIIQTAGKQTIWIPAGAMKARTTNGPTSSTTETTTNDIMVPTLSFNKTTEQGAGFWVTFPKSWNKSSITYSVVWTTAAASGDVLWGLAGYSFSDGDALDTAVSGQQTVLDTAGTANTVRVSSESPALTVGGAGSPSIDNNDAVYFEFTREAANGSDTLDDDAKVLGVKIIFTTNAADDS